MFSLPVSSYLSTSFFFAISLIILLGLFLYWALIITEGAFLGPRVVRWLYDQGASSYDQIKQYDPLDEAAFLANPIFSRLEERFGPHTRLLDVATGTARLPLALLAIPFYKGEIVGLDASRQMLNQAEHKMTLQQAQGTTDVSSRLTLLHHPAVPLPFADHSFHAVTCLEALEFMPNRHAALREMIRVLSPSGLIVLSNRIGSDTWFMPTRTDSPEEFEHLLQNLGLIDIITRPWQEHYDLIFARKPALSTSHSK